MPNKRLQPTLAKPRAAEARRQAFKNMKKETQLRVVVIVAACWIILMPPIWARAFSSRSGLEYFEFLAFYVSELVAAAACLILLPGAWARKGWAVGGLVLAAVLLSILKHGHVFLWALTPVAYAQGNGVPNATPFNPMDGLSWCEVPLSSAEKCSFTCGKC